MAQFSCDKCPKSFATISKFNYHQKDCHPADETLKVCKLCGKTFSSISTRQRHEDTGCKKERSVVWIPPAVVNKEELNNRHVLQRNELSDKNKQIIELFKEYLIDGTTSVVILSRGKQNLEPSSVESYVSHFRVYAGFVEAANTSNDIVDCVLRVKTIKDFVKYSNDSNYKQKTILNRLLAIERFCGFIDEKLEELNARNLTARKPSKQTKTSTSEAMSWISAQLRVLRPVAAKETLVRNSREVYEQEGRWIAVNELFSKEKELSENINVLIDQIANNPGRKPTMTDLQSIQKFVLYSLVICRPPLRAQNFDLTILEEVENPKTAKSNAIIFNESQVILQYAKFKTHATYGFTKFVVSDELAKLLRLFVKHVRPWFFNNKNVPLIGSSLFVNQVGTRLQSVGSYFIDIMEEYFGKRLEISMIRKVMETAVSECSALSTTDKDTLSKAMLHDPETAQRYYVVKDSTVQSQAINKQWDIFRQHYSQQLGGEVISNNATPTLVPVQTSNLVESNTNQIPQIELIPTSMLSQRIALSKNVPSLEESSDCSSGELVETEQTARQVAEQVASKLLSPLKSTSAQRLDNNTSSSPRVQNKYPLKPGDWPCSMCGYINFSYREVCNCCGKDKNKRSAYEEDGPVRKKSKINSDITAVLKKGYDKDKQVIYKVNSVKFGEVWVKAKDVPTHLL